MKLERDESLFRTVSGDHRSLEYPEYVGAMSLPYRRSGGVVAAYEGAILGGGHRLYGLGELELWLRRHRYAAYDMGVLLPAAQLCLEYGVRRRLRGERPGLAAMGGAAAARLLAEDPLRWRHSARGWLWIWWLTQQFPQAANPASGEMVERLAGFEPVLVEFRALIEGSVDCQDARALVEQAVKVYKKIFTRYFAPDHSEDPLPEGAEREGDGPGEEDARPREVELQLAYGKGRGPMPEGFELSEDALAAVPRYLERHFGPSWCTAAELSALEGKVCVGVHEGRHLLLTDGLPRSAYEGTSEQGANLRAGVEANRRMLAEHQEEAHQAIRSIVGAFRSALSQKYEPEVYTTDHGRLSSRSLWQVGWSQEPKLFEKVVQQESRGVVVELLVDASGSQTPRQAMVAFQSYLFSAALTELGIAHRVMSYCTYGDHTVLRRFRDYGDGPVGDERILEYHATSNNRDGLALAAAGEGLLGRREEHKMMIVFSDGLPNDMVSGRRRTGAPEKYIGQAAVQDTCAQVRKLRRAGIHVIGIFLGSDEELENERKIYGTSFLRIRRAEDFGGSAGRKLSETLLQL